MKIKSIIMFALAALLVLFFVGCGENNTSESTSAASAEAFADGSRGAVEGYAPAESENANDAFLAALDPSLF